MLSMSTLMQCHTAYMVICIYYYADSSVKRENKERENKGSALENRN